MLLVPKVDGCCCLRSQQCTSCFLAFLALTHILPLFYLLARSGRIHMPTVSFLYVLFGLCWSGSVLMCANSAMTALNVALALGQQIPSLMGLGSTGCMGQYGKRTLASTVPIPLAQRSHSTTTTRWSNGEALLVVAQEGGVNARVAKWRWIPQHNMQSHDALGT